jgi:hypothetical protein
MQIQFSSNSQYGKHRCQLQQQQRPHQLHQMMMLQQSRSTDSQIDVETYQGGAKHRKNERHDNTSIPSPNDSSSKNHTKMSIPSFFVRTNPSLLNDSSESSSSSSSLSTSIRIKEKTNTGSLTTSTCTPTAKNAITSRRPPASQDIFRIRFEINSEAAKRGTDDDDRGTDTDTDTTTTTPPIQNQRKRVHDLVTPVMTSEDIFSTSVYDSHGNGAWIQRSYAFEDDEDESDQDNDDDYHYDEPAYAVR